MKWLRLLVCSASYVKKTHACQPALQSIIMGFKGPDCKLRALTACFTTAAPFPSVIKDYSINGGGHIALFSRSLLHPFSHIDHQEKPEVQWFYQRAFDI